MNESSKRPRRFQIHLSTAVVLMFAAGALMWANIRPAKQIVSIEADLEPVEETSEVIPGDPLFEKRGWPLWATTQRVGVAAGPPRAEVYYSLPCPMHCDYYRAVYDGVIALTLLTWTYLICEWCIRRSTASKIS